MFIHLNLLRNVTRNEKKRQQAIEKTFNLRTTKRERMRKWIKGPRKGRATDQCPNGNVARPARPRNRHDRHSSSTLLALTLRATAEAKKKLSEKGSKCS